MQNFMRIFWQSKVYFFIAFYCVVLVAFSRYAPNLDDLGYFALIYQKSTEIFTTYGGGNPLDG
ncbi:hypothetical protein, partial [Helicobacter sp. 23-1045]